MRSSEVIVVGSGIAALQTALGAAITKNVIIFTKDKLRSSNSYLAQGGIAAAISAEDSTDKHAQDTLLAGRNYNNPDAVLKLVQEAPAVMNSLILSGMEFDRERGGKVSLGMEGAHSERRIMHRDGDATGKYLIEHYLSQLEKSSIKVMEEKEVIELIIGEDDSCIGVKTLDPEGRKESYYGNHIVLATGGCGALYRFTSNSPGVTGDGIAMALKAGARIKDMEFIQFHPTLLFINGKTHGLVSEAVRGEGAKLVTESDKKVMEGVHPLNDLAPRHIVAQTIYAYLQQGERVYLDISMIPAFKKRFPTISLLCERNGIDNSSGKIPVAPGNHFLMGGIETDNVGRTSVRGLYAVGEAACSGVHGANRLASNSLLEGIVFGKAVGSFIASEPERELPNQRFEPTNRSHIPTLPSLSELSEKLMRYAGIIRNETGLETLLDWLGSFDLAEVLEGSGSGLTKEQIRAANGILVAWLIAESALCRKESRGGHFRSDYPVENDKDWLKQSVVIDKNKMEKRLKGRRYHEQIKVKATT
ncbi:L-aspartate oxidase [Peribacillus cavernae]|uniref:L-aspartate oxidase n=1 Tax=Peribacillus cavernae TaxID=1674310 RepID=A0A433HHG6_9BACI|nr:L-aspartate oxidase [Peribacillus cavernae]MDQ0219355.1 L-aspartate oxidase [Peribacillus cavernae]RUQ27768.1 L-aspartate oxidase [Peribacillus cavernae]